MLAVTAPRMGGVSRTSATESTAWVGGKPNADWTVLDASASRICSTPHQMRPTSVSASHKLYTTRVAGLESKFEKNKTDLVSFQTKVDEHLTSHGLDTIAWIPDPENPTTIMAYVISHHAKYKVETARAAVLPLRAKWDDYDKNNDSQATKFLLNSLNEDMAKAMRAKAMKDDAFVTHWVMLVREIRSNSLKKYEGIIADMKALKPSDQPHQDLVPIIAKYREFSAELTVAGQFDHKLTLHMLETLMSVGGEDNEDYRSPLRVLRRKLEAAILATGYKDRVGAQQHMDAEGLDYKTVLQEAEDEFRNLWDSHKWPPRQSVSDSKAAPRNFGANLAAAQAQLDFEAAKTQLNLLIQRAGGGTAPASGSSKASADRPCNLCGSANHWASACPQRGRQQGTSGGGGRGRSGPGGHSGGRGSSGRGGRGGSLSGGRGRGTTPFNWKKVAPKAGDPQTKSADGQTYHWCAKCARWTASHDTAAHGTTNQANFLVQEHAIWNFEVEEDKPWGLVSLLCLFFGFLTYLVVSLSGLLFWFPGPIMWLIGNWAVLLGPLTWVLAFVLGQNYRPLPAPDPPGPHRSRKERRHYSRGQNRANKPRRAHNSARRSGLHQAYPMRLRSAGLFVYPHAPTIDEREKQVGVERMLAMALELEKVIVRLKNSCRKPLPSMNDPVPLRRARERRGRGQQVSARLEEPEVPDRLHCPQIRPRHRVHNLRHSGPMHRPTV